MNLIKFDPFQPAPYRRGLFDEFFNRNIGDIVGSDFVTSVPSVNVTESETGFHIELAAPGLTKDNIKVSVEKNLLVISSEKKAEEEVKEGKYRRREWNYSSFMRSFQLPKIVDHNAIDASYENGVLSVELPKKAEIVEEERERMIEIK